MIPVSTVVIPDAAADLVAGVLRSGMLAQGHLVQQFEEQFAALTGVRHAVAVNSGTTALVAALQVLDLEPGDEVVTSPFTFVATLNAILEAGATAVFADIDTADFNLDPGALESAITSGTKALMPVHLYGQCADMDAITALARRHDLQVVEDAAQAHAASFGDRRAGSFGLGCFSFYATKNITTGEGGMITTDDDVRADRLQVLRNQGMRERYGYEMPGHNYRLTEVQAALGIPQLAQLAETTSKRRHNAARLTDGLSDVTGLRLPRQMPGRGHVWHQFTVLVTDEAPVDRDEFVRLLADRGVGSGVYYPRPVFDYACYRNHPRVRVSPVPAAEDAARRVVSLPVHPGLSATDIDTIIETVREVMKA
ncbi:MAG TPA: DegT/DnrJ/EryC1/StrS family aminotransferase [Jatrophihabitantaceae bacterium]|jgi:dTDP-4-amino-4,6-dideoxygalactose transaminase|nr:DegT/DnrJ/EryC1/StrS family aminotransferase [Jatrophihabitantaceae bacterium]